MRMYVTRTESNNGGIGLLGVLQIIFIVLKLCNLISWSWWLVLIPTWISLGLCVLVLLYWLVVSIWEHIT